MKGIRRDRYGFRAYVKVGTHQREKRYPADTAAKVMQDWRDETRVALRALKPSADAPGTFADAVARYLKQVAAMPTYAERERHLTLWLDALGRNTLRADITAGDIRAVLQGWRAAGLEPATCNKRRSALMHLWTVLDGKGASNPVRNVKKFRVADPVPRGRDPHVIDAALKARPHSRTRAVCRVLLWTGMRPVELERAERDDVDFHQKIAVIRTAKGGRTRVIPLTSQAVQAWKEFDHADCWGNIPSAAPMNRLLKKWTGMDVRIYDLRHSYGTALALRDTRLDVIGALMGHSTLELTKRYTLAAVSLGAHSATRKLAQKAGSRKKVNNDGRKSA